MKGTESLKPCIVSAVQLSVKQFSAQEFPILRIRLAESQEEEQRQLQSVLVRSSWQVHFFKNLLRFTPLWNACLITIKNAKAATKVVL